jgi:mRNA interferase MazF
VASIWEVWLVNLDPVIGSEQGNVRPVLVMSNEDVNKLLNAINVIPFTTKKKERIVYANEVLIPTGNFGLKNES